MFRRGKDEPTEGPSQPHDRSDRRDRDGGRDSGALDAVAAILRSIPDTGLQAPGADPDEVRARFEGWARHALVLGPAPGREGLEPAPAQRDWTGLRKYTIDHLRDSASGLSQAIDDLQDVVWTVVEGISHAVADDSSTDAKAAASLERLRSAASSGDPSSLKEVALSTIGELTSLIAERATRQHALASELGERVGTLQEQLAEAQRAADVDGLTRLANRPAIDRELKRSSELRALLREPVCLLLIDLDRFKSINDTYGHPAGDEVLRSFSDTLALTFPRRNDVVGRYGGEEFAVILRNANEDDGARLAQRLVEATRALRIETPAGAVGVTTSVGVAEAVPLEGVETWVGRADQALYAAKNAGRDRMEIAPIQPVADAA